MTTHVSTLPAAPQASELGTGHSAAVERSESIIDRDSHFNGLYETKQDLRIEGLAEGDIQCQGTLLVAEGARVKAKVTASTITIAGLLDGEVLCHGVFQILPTGQVQATVSAHRLIVQEGGLYNGEFRMISGPAYGPSDAPAREASAGGAETLAEEPEIGSEAWWKKLSEVEPVNKDGEAEIEPDQTT